MHEAGESVRLATTKADLGYFLEQPDLFAGQIWQR